MRSPREPVRVVDSGNLTPLRSLNLREQAREAIRASIITGELEPGQTYSARLLADRLGVSATPVREAMLDLTRERLLQIVRNKGFVIPKLSDPDLQHIFELRMLLEVPSMQVVVARISGDEVEELRVLAEDNKRAASAGDLVKFLATDRKFHLALLAPLGNQRLIEIVGSLRDQQRLYGLAELSRSGRLVDSALEHQEILTSISCGSSADAEARMRRHLQHTRGIWAGRDEFQEESQASTPVASS